VLICIVVARRTQQTIYTAIGMTCISLLGLIVLTATESVGGRLAGYYLSWAEAAAQALVITVIGNNVSGYTKKVRHEGWRQDKEISLVSLLPPLGYL
jgi:hypothetical protein